MMIQDLVRPFVITWNIPNILPFYHNGEHCEQEPDASMHQTPYFFSHQMLENQCIAFESEWMAMRHQKKCSERKKCWWPGEYIQSQDSNVHTMNLIDGAWSEGSEEYVIVLWWSSENDKTAL